MVRKEHSMYFNNMNGINIINISPTILSYFAAITFNETCCLENGVPSVCMGLCIKDFGHSMKEKPQPSLPDICKPYKEVIKTECVVSEYKTRKGMFMDLS